MLGPLQLLRYSNGGVSACHWKAHNTFTQFYLKDVAWADSELYHSGPVFVFSLGPVYLTLLEFTRSYWSEF